MAQLISQSHELCIQTFQQLCKAAADSERCPESFRLALLDELDKYRIWNGNLGASHVGRTYKLSLDYRLREATFYKEQVIIIVDTLQRHVEDARQIVCGERKPFEDFSESDSDEESPDLSPSNETPYGKGHDSPWESSSESGSTPEPEPSKVGPKSLDETSGLLPPATELAQLLEAIKLTIRSLYKLPIRKPAPVDRLKGDLTDAVSCFQPFDCMYVRDKFPCLSGEVADRIGSHITRRRQLLLYRHEHQELLRPKKVHNEPKLSLVSTEFQNIDVKQYFVKTGDETPSAQIHHATTTSQAESKPQTIRSKATTFLHDENQPLQPDFLSAPSVAESISQTSIAASQFTREMPVEVPPRPKDSKGTSKTMFECNFCVLTTYIKSDTAWRKHVLSDLQPYVCTFPECNLGDHMFATRDAWFQHEMQLHRVEYFCNTEAHPVHRDLSEFKDHIQQEHDISLGNLTNPAAMNMFRRPVSSSEGICNLCFREQPVKNMKSHVSKHLEQISLFAIPRAEYGEDDGDAGENQSDQAQHNVEKSVSQDEELRDRSFRNSSPPLKKDLSWLSPAPYGPNVDWNKMVGLAEQEYLHLLDHHPDQEKRLRKLIYALYQRFMSSRNLSDLEIVSALSDVQLSLLPVDSPERGSLMAFQLALRRALRPSIPEGQQHLTIEHATETTLASDSENPSVRMRYAQSMLAQYWRTADPEYLNNAYLWAVEVVHSENLVDSGHLVQFGIILAEKFSHWGNLNDLDEAVRYAEEGVQSAEETSENFYLMAYGLSNILCLQFHQLAEPNDLEKAVTEAQRVYDTASSANVYERTHRSIILATLRLIRIRAFRTSDDLKRAIEQANDTFEILRKDGNQILPPELLRDLEEFYSLELAKIRNNQDLGLPKSLKSNLAMAVYEDLLDIQRLVLERK